MIPCGCCLSRRALLFGAIGLGLGAGTAAAQAPELISEEIARGRVDYAEAVGGPADLITLKLTFPPGTIMSWHLHPATVEGIIVAGELTMYHSDGCKSVYGPGSGVLVPAGTIHEEHNEGTVTLEVLSTFLQPVGQPLRVPVPAPDAAC